MLHQIAVSCSRNHKNAEWSTVLFDMFIVVMSQSGLETATSFWRNDARIDESLLRNTYELNLRYEVRRWRVHVDPNLNGHQSKHSLEKKTWKNEEEASFRKFLGLAFSITWQITSSRPFRYIICYFFAMVWRVYPGAAAAVNDLAYISKRWVIFHDNWSQLRFATGTQHTYLEAPFIFHLAA